MGLSPFLETVTIPSWDIALLLAFLLVSLSSIARGDYAFLYRFTFIEILLFAGSAICVAIKLKRLYFKKK